MIEVIAEAGVNHNGRLVNALKLVDVARRAGADVVKFQAAVPELVVSRLAEQAPYQIRNTGKIESQLDMLKRIHLPLTDFEKIKLHCDDVGIEFMCTAFDFESFRVIDELGVNRHKIPSGEVTNKPFLELIGLSKKPLIISTGMASISEVSECLQVVFADRPRRNLKLLHCVTQYPAQFRDSNLRSLATLKETFACDVGYSDHSVGNTTALVALGLGAILFEKHFTLDQNQPGPDHKASASPEGLSSYVSVLRSAAMSLGDGIKKIAPGEVENLAVARRSICAAREIRAGSKINAKDLVCLRPGVGISPMRINEIIGTSAVVDFKIGDLIRIE